MANRLGPMVAQPQLAVQPDPLLLREGALLLLQLEGDVEQALFHALGRHGVAEEGEVIAEHQDRARVEHLLVRSHELLEKDRRHGGDVLVAEPDIGDHEPFVSRLDRRDADRPLGGIHDPMAGDDLLAERHGARRGGRG